jgi:hypothetical protein
MRAVYLVDLVKACRYNLFNFFNRGSNCNFPFVGFKLDELSVNPAAEIPFASHKSYKLIHIERRKRKKYICLCQGLKLVFSLFALS